MAKSDGKGQRQTKDFVLKTGGKKSIMTFCVDMSSFFNYFF